MRYDVVVCGAGPAGMCCALFLAKGGRKVLLLEKGKFPRDKVCADNKTWKCLDIVKELGLWKEFEKLPKKEIRGMLSASPSGHQITTPLLPSDVAQKGTWYNVRRLLFDDMLASACRKSANIEFLENNEVLGPVLEGETVVGARFYSSKRKGEVRQAFAKVVVGADGSQSAIAKELGVGPVLKGRFAMNARAYYKGVAGAKDLCELYYLKGICPGYFWIFPVDGGMCNVGIGMRVEDLERQGISLQGKMDGIISSEKFSGRFARAKKVSETREWGVSVLPGKRKWSGNGFVLVGDAGTFAMTFSGEGVGPGMRSGKVAAHAILRAFARNDFSARSLSDFDDSMWEILRPEVEGFKWLEFLILHERVFDWVWRRAAGKKELIELSSKMQNDYSASREFVSLRTLLRLLF